MEKGEPSCSLAHSQPARPPYLVQLRVAVAILQGGQRRILALDRPARAGEDVEGLGGRVARATRGKHACAQAAAAAEGWGRGTSARARWEPAKYLEEVGGEVERSGVEERLRGRATVRGGGLPSTRAETGLGKLSRDLHDAIYVRREPASFPWCDSVLRGCSVEQ